MRVVGPLSIRFRVDGSRFTLWYDSNREDTTHAGTVYMLDDEGELDAANGLVATFVEQTALAALERALDGNRSSRVQRGNRPIELDTRSLLVDAERQTFGRPPQRTAVAHTPQHERPRVLRPRELSFNGIADTYFNGLQSPDPRSNEYGWAQFNFKRETVSTIVANSLLLHAVDDRRLIQRITPGEEAIGGAKMNERDIIGLLRNHSFTIDREEYVFSVSEVNDGLIAIALQRRGPDGVDRTQSISLGYRKRIQGANGQNGEDYVVMTYAQVPGVYNPRFEADALADLGMTMQEWKSLWHRPTPVQHTPVYADLGLGQAPRGDAGQGRYNYQHQGHPLSS